MIKRRLFTPGPVSLYPPALSAALEANIHHRTPEFKGILASVMAALKRVMGDPESVYLFASSGTGAMEASVVNFFSPGESVLVASCGKFGERWIELVNRFGLNAVFLQAPYGEAVDPAAIERKLKENPVLRGVFVQACESSTGIQNDIESIAGIVERSDAILIADCITGLATMPLSPKWGIDVIISGSQKALMIPPGLAFLGVSDRAWKRVEASTSPRYYFDLKAARKAWEKDGQTSFTPATSLVLSLQKSLEFVEQIGMEKLIHLTENRARATRAGVAALGLSLFAKRPASAMTAVLPPAGEAEKISSQLKNRFGLQVAGGQGDMKGKIFRISHMGFIDHFDLLGVLSALEIILKESGHPVELGKSLQAFQQIFAEVA